MTGATNYLADLKIIGIKLTHLACVDQIILGRGSLDDASKFSRTENAQCVGSPLSGRPVLDVRGGETQQSSLMTNQAINSVSPSGSYIGRNISSLQPPEAAHEGRVITRDLPGRSVNHPRFSRPSPTPQCARASRGCSAKKERLA